MAQRPRVLLLIPHLGGGGAERIVSLLSGGLASEKYEIHLGLITQSRQECESGPAGVEIHALGVSRVRSGAIPLLRLVRMLKPDLILSGIAHLNFLVLLLRPLFPRKTRIVIRQNSTASADLESGRLPGYTRSLYRFLYPRADRVVCQSDAMAQDLVSLSRLSLQQLLVLPNPVDAESIRALRTDHRWIGCGPHLLAVGRLSWEKGFDLLLEAFSSLRVKFPAADLTILGTGPEITALRKLRRELRLETSVHFPGHVLRPMDYFPGATLFVLPSRTEGLPNALLEAAAGGLPIVAAPCSEGVVHLLRNHQGAWLAGEVSANALTRALLAALGCIQAGQRFAHSWIDEFRMDRAIANYEHMIDETLQRQ